MANKQQKQGVEKSKIIAGVAAAVVVLGGVIALAVGISGSSGTIVSADVSISGSVLPRYVDANSVEPAAGMRAPVLRGKDLYDEDIVIDVAASGKPTILLFLAHWCPACQEEVKELTEWVNDGGDLGGVEIYSVVTLVDRGRGNWPPGAWLEREGWPFRSIVDDTLNSITSTYYGLSHNDLGGAPTPFFVVINAQGEIVARIAGQVPIDVFEVMLALARGETPETFLPDGVSDISIEDAVETSAAN